MPRATSKTGIRKAFMFIALSSFTFDDMIWYLAEHLTLTKFYIISLHRPNKWQIHFVQCRSPHSVPNKIQHYDVSNVYVIPEHSIQLKVYFLFSFVK